MLGWPEVFERIGKGAAAIETAEAPRHNGILRSARNRRRLRVGATLAACALALAWFVAGYPTVIYDSWGYFYLANIVRTTGLASWPAPFRTYGYPLFEAVVTGFRDLPAEEFRLVVFAAQLAVYLAACAIVARRLGAILGSPRLAAAAYALGALNPVLLLHATETLSDLLSAVLVLLAVAFAWRLPGKEGRPIRDAYLSFLCAGAAAVVRPASLVVVFPLGVVWLLRAVRWRELSWRQAGAAVLGFVPPFLPQVAINYRATGRFSPLITENLYGMQVGWGMGALKYGTLVIPGHSPFLVYSNPFYRGDPGPLEFLRNHPLDYLATLALHGFGILDHDLPFTYVTDLAPWYRWPLAAVNFSILYLALAGLAFAVARAVRLRRLDEAGFAALAATAVALGYTAIYLPVEVESRFGLALQALATPLVILGLAAAAGPPRARTRARMLAYAGLPLALGAAFFLSRWIERHRTNPFVESPANAFLLDPPRAKRAPPGL